MQTFTPKPCAHCVGSTFTVIPNLAVELWRPGGAIFGMTGYEKVHANWNYTLVICMKCSRTETFTTNTAELIKRVPGAYSA